MPHDRDIVVRPANVPDAQVPIGTPTSGPIPPSTTQDILPQGPGFVESRGGFGALFLDVLTGAAAGSQARDLGAGFIAGTQVAARSRGEREGQRRFDIQEGRRQREEERRVSQEARREEQFEQQTLQNTLSRLGTVINTGQARFHNETLRQGRAFNQGELVQSGVGNPLTDEDWNEIEKQTGSARTLAQLDAFIFSGDQLVNGNTPAKRKAASDAIKAISAVTDFSIIEKDGQPAMVTVNGAHFDFSVEGARDLKEFVRKREVANIQQRAMDRSTASEGNSALANNFQADIEGLNSLSFEEKRAGQVAYQNVINNDPVKRDLTQLGVNIDRFLKGKQSPIEQAEAIKFFREGNIGFDILEDGSAMLDFDSINEFARTRSSVDADFNLLPSGFGKADEATINLIFERSGINAAKKQFVDQLATLNETKRNAGAARIQSELGVVRAKADIAAGVKARAGEAKEQKIQNNIRSGRFKGQSTQDIIDVLQPSGAQLQEIQEDVFVEMFKAGPRVKNLKDKKIAKNIQESLNTAFKAEFPDSEDNLSDALSKKDPIVLAWFKDRPELQNLGDVFGDKGLDNLMRSQLRRFARVPGIFNRAARESRARQPSGGAAQQVLQQQESAASIDKFLFGE